MEWIWIIVAAVIGALPGTLALCLRHMDRSEKLTVEATFQKRPLDSSTKVTVEWRITNCSDVIVRPKTVECLRAGVPCQASGTRNKAHDLAVTAIRPKIQERVSRKTYEGLKPKDTMQSRTSFDLFDTPRAGQPAALKPHKIIFGTWPLRVTTTLGKRFSVPILDPSGE